MTLAHLLSDIRRHLAGLRGGAGRGDRGHAGGSRSTNRNVIAR